MGSRNILANSRKFSVYAYEKQSLTHDALDIEYTDIQYSTTYHILYAWPCTYIAIPLAIS